MATASSASRTYGRPASTSEWTATARSPMRCTVRITRRAISPRLATSTVSNTKAGLPGWTTSARETNGVVLVLLVAVGALGVALVTRGTGLGRVHLRAVRLLVAAAAVQLVTSTLAPGSVTARVLALVLTTLLVG